MKKQCLYLIISSCFYLPALGQEKSTNLSTVSHHYSIQEFRGKFHNPASRVGQQNLKTNYVYKEKLDSIITYNYDEEIGKWNKKFTKETFTYDTDSNEILRVYSAWSVSDNNWTNLLKDESQYNETVNSRVNTQFVWSENQWNKDRKWIYKYNQNNELIQKLNYQWEYDLDGWLLAERWDYSYNAQGKPLTDSLYWWYANSQEWKLQEKVDYEYINDNELHYIFYSNWDSNTNQWIRSEKEWYLYDLQWRLITLSSYEWHNSSEGNWKLTNRKGYSYDEGDYLKKYANVVIKPPKANGSLQHELMWETYEFDFSLMFSDILLPNYLNHQELKFHHKLLNTNLSQYNYDTKQEEQYRAVEYHYSPVVETVTGGKDILSENISIYPIPAKESIYINYHGEHSQALFELYNTNGGKVISSTINKAESIDISALRKGFYIYHIKVDQYESVGKLIKE